MLPATHRSLTVVDDPRGIVVKEKPLPVFGDEDILIKVVAVTLNPTDFKHVFTYASLKAGDSLGCDFAGDVVSIGKHAEGKGLKVGDAVAGFIRGGIPDSDNGSFQAYVKTRPESVWHVPKDVLSYEDASSMGGIALSTAVQALYHRLRLPTPWAPAKEPFPVLIWAGATSVGIYAIRLAKLSGLNVATTASPKNHALMKELGADVVFDYKDPEAPAKIKEWSGGKLAHAFDPIAEHGSTKLVSQAFGDKGGTVVTVLPVQKDEGFAANVEPVRIYIYSALLKENKDDFEAMAEWNSKLPSFSEKLKVMPLKRWAGGLDAIPEALEYLRAGKTSAEKISVLI